jgi:hypothetical protein
MIVHVLIAGQTPCGMEGLPGNWPAGHKWARENDIEHVTCPECLEFLKGLNSESPKKEETKKPSYEEMKKCYQELQELAKKYNIKVVLAMASPTWQKFGVSNRIVFEDYTGLLR